MRFLRLRVSIFGGDKIVEANFWSLGSDFFGELFARLCVYYRRRDNKIKISKTSNYWNYSFFMKRKIKYILKIRLINLRLFSFFSWERKRQKVYLRRSGQFLVTSHLISLVVHPEESWILDQLLWWPLIIIHEYEITIVFGRTESSIIFFQKDMRYPATWKRDTANRIRFKIFNYS